MPYVESSGAWRATDTNVSAALRSYEFPFVRPDGSFGASASLRPPTRAAWSGVSSPKAYAPDDPLTLALPSLPSLSGWLGFDSKYLLWGGLAVAAVLALKK